MQVASLRSSAEAEQALSGARLRFASLLGAQDSRIQKADLRERGTYYRVQFGPLGSAASASGLCRELQSARQDCFLQVEREADRLSERRDAPRFTEASLAAIDETDGPGTKHTDRGAGVPRYTAPGMPGDSIMTLLAQADAVHGADALHRIDDGGAN